MEILTKQSVFAVGHYLWCAAVTNIFLLGLIQTATYAGAQINAVKTLGEIKETAKQVLTAQEKKDHAVSKVDLDD